MFSTLKVSSFKNAANSSYLEFRTLMQCNFMVPVTTKVLSHTGSLGAHFSWIVWLDIYYCYSHIYTFYQFIIGYCIIWGSCSGADISPKWALYSVTNPINCSFPMRGSKEIPNNFEIEFIFPSMKVWKRKTLLKLWG